MTKRIVRNYFLGFVWTAGLLFAGSDNNYMPWPNLFGMVIFGMASWGAAGKTFRLRPLAGILKWNRRKPVQDHNHRNLAFRLNKALSRISRESERYRTKAFILRS